MPDITALPGFYRIARADPGRRAVIDADGTTTSYGELLARVNQVSHGLRARGLTRGDVVAGVLPNGLDQVVMLMATGQIGLYYVPVNWHLTDAEIAYILADCDARVVVAGPGRPVAGALPGAAALAAGQPVTDPADRTAGSVMWYTSGTTGFPRASSGGCPAPSRRPPSRPSPGSSARSATCGRATGPTW